jgi:hypothetical protein
MKTTDSNEALAHTSNIKEEFALLIDHLREDAVFIQTVKDSLTKASFNCGKSVRHNFR